MTHSEIINDITHQFSIAAKDLMSVTYKEVIKISANNIDGYFGKLYVKPSKRLARLLTIENEFLVFISTFREQQFRSITYAKELIEEARGRLEPTVALIIHRDLYGDNKLKKWGRQQGMSILPLYFDGQFQKGDSLENQLLSELYSNDPFDITGPVSDDSQFYGRRTEAIDLSRKLSSGQIRTCLGIRKIGKTSLMNRILVELEKQNEAKAIIIDCSKDYIWEMSASKLMAAISTAITNAINSTSPQTILTNINTENNDISNAASGILSVVNSVDYPIILFFDEIDYITPSSPTTKHWNNDFNIFWRNLRGVYQDASRFNHNLGIFISGVTSKWFNVESINGIENAALAFVPEEYLSPLPKGSSEQMIKTLARTSGLQLEDKVAALISEYCSDIPYWIRKACSYIHRNIPFDKRPYKPEIEDIDKLLASFLITEGGVLSRVALMHLTKVYPELSIPILQINKEEISSISKPVLATLEKYGVIKTLGKIRIAGSLMKEGANLIAHFAEEPTEVESIDSTTTVSNKLSFDNYDEWADELAFLNRERNILEKKLRGLVVNFIRMDSLSNKSKGSTTDRVLKVIPSDKRNIFQNLSPEECLNKFLWTDLYRLMEKEWLIFERIFNDKSQFIFNATIINERSDTHAKDADVADIAIQRRSIKWFDDKLRIL